MTSRFTPSTGNYPSGEGKVKTFLNKIFPVSKTADKLQTTVARIPRYVYWIAAALLLIGIGAFMWNRTLIQFTKGKRKGDPEGRCARPGSTGIIQIGGAKELANPPDWKFVFGKGVPTVLPASNALVGIDVNAAVTSGLNAEGGLAPAVVSTSAASGATTVAAGGEASVAAMNANVNPTVRLLETIGIHHGYN